MKRLLILFLLSPLASFACDCLTSGMTEAKLNAQSYVALVKIKEQLPFDEEKFENGTSNLPLQYEVLIEEITLFKGTSLKKLKVWGAPPRSSMMTSCDINVSPGQEWLIIANVEPNRGVSFGMCSNSLLYREKDGFRNWQYSPALKWLKAAVKIFPNASALALDLEKPVLHYPNGQIERNVSYKKNKKEGPALYYYPDGRIYGRAEYKGDSLHGKRIWYNRKGEIQSKATFDMGLPVDSMVTYMYPNEPSYISIYSKQGILEKTQFYQGRLESRKSYIVDETVYSNDKRASITHYRKDGTISSISVFHEGGSIVSSFNEAGTLIQKREFDIGGNFIRSVPN